MATEFKIGTPVQMGEARGYVFGATDDGQWTARLGWPGGAYAFVTKSEAEWRAACSAAAAKVSEEGESPAGFRH